LRPNKLTMMLRGLGRCRSAAKTPGIISGVALVAASLALGPGSALAQSADSGTIVHNTPLRVCADPDNLPFSNRAGQGFENKLAEMVAKSLDTTVAYTWFPERRGFLRNTLEADECDVVMGTPNVDGVLATRSYYRSGYVFVSRADRHLTVSTMTDPALRTLRIGVQVIGGDGNGTPPAVVLGQEGIVQHVVGYPVYGDFAGPQPAAAPIAAVARGDIDIAALWGPTAGYFAKSAEAKLRVTPIAGTEQFLPQIFDYPIAMAVRSSDTDLRDRLNAFIRSHRADIAALLKRYGVPVI
jgi:quinoprotein dehydrogenase-associated probable ABC transporter substrate-binding protein